MRHFYIEIPTTAALVAPGTRTVTIQECADADDLDLPNRVYLGSTDDDGNPTTALAGIASASLSAIRGPFFKAAVRDGMQEDKVVPCVVNADHVALCLKSSDNAAVIVMDGGLRFDLDDPYDTIADELFGVSDVDED